MIWKRIFGRRTAEPSHEERSPLVTCEACGKHIPEGSGVTMIPRNPDEDDREYCLDCLMKSERMPDQSESSKPELTPEEHLDRAAEILKLAGELARERFPEEFGEEQDDSDTEVHQFVYGRCPGKEGGSGEYELMDRESAEELVGAAQCRTWGEYAETLGFSWEQIQLAWSGHEVLASLGVKDPKPQDTFPYAKLFELFGSKVLFNLPDPREVAYDLLVDEIPWEDPELAATIEVKDDPSPGEVRAISGSTRAGMERLAEIINDHFPGGATLHEDEVLTAATHGLTTRGEERDLRDAASRPGDTSLARIAEQARATIAAPSGWRCVPPVKGEDVLLASTDDRIAVLSWGFFNPFGPTMVHLDLVPVPGRDEYLLASTQHHPLNSYSVVYGVLHSSQVHDAEELARVLNELATYNGAEDYPILGGSLPTHVIIPASSPLTEQQLRGPMFRLAGWAQETDIHAWIALVQQYWQRPWDRTAEEVKEAFRSFASKPSPTREEPMPLTAALFDRWWKVVTDPEHVQSETSQMSAAWEGSVESMRGKYIEEYEESGDFALDPERSDAGATSGGIADTYVWDFAATEEGYRRAVEANPNDAGAHIDLASLLIKIGKPEEAFREARTAVELDPLDMEVHNILGAMYDYSGQPQHAVEAYQTAIALAPDALDASYIVGNLALTYSELGRHADAIRTAERARGLDAEDPFTRSVLGVVYGRAGKQAEAERALAELRAMPDASSYMIATVYAALGEKERAFQMLEQAVERGDDETADLGVDPAFKHLRDDPRFARLLHKIGLG